VSVLLASSALAQTPAPLTFDVASVKINAEYSQANRNTWQSSIKSSPGSVTMRNVNLTMITAWAFHVQRPQVSGPQWLDDNRYDISAKAATPAEDDQLRLMLQSLLADRFKFTSHRDTRTMEVMAFILPKSGHKMKVSDIEGPPQSTQDPERGVIVKGAPLSAIAEDLSKELNMPLLNMTGLEGRFDFSLKPEKYVAEMRARVMAGGPQSMPPEAQLKLTLMEQIVEGELGLRLESRKAPVELIVIDHVEKTPAEN